MNETIRLIALDMDGTLMNSEGRVSPGNLQAIERATACGIQVLIATGRIYGAAQLFHAQTGITLPMMCANGAVIYNQNGDALYKTNMHASSVLQAIDMAEQQDFYYHLFYDKALLIRSADGPAAAYLRRNQAMPQQDRMDIRQPDLKGMRQAAQDGVQKMGIYSYDAARLQALRERIAQLSDMEVSSSWPTNIELTLRGVDKGTALAWYCRSMGISPDHAMAMGDNENDLSMLQTAHYSVAMGNATDAALSAARYVTAHHDHDGVALAIRHLVFGEDVGDLKTHASKAKGVHSDAQTI